MSGSAGRQRRADNVILSNEDAVKQVLVDSVLGLWDVVNNLTRLRPSRHDRYRVTIFGSARAQAGSFATRKPSAWPAPSPRSAATSSPGADPG